MSIIQSFKIQQLSSSDFLPSKHKNTHRIYARSAGTVPPKSVSLILVGCKSSFPDSYFAQLHSTSHMRERGVKVVPSVCDSDYRGECGVIVYNESDLPFSYREGQCVGVMVFVKVLICNFEVVDTFVSMSR